MCVRILINPWLRTFALSSSNLPISIHDDFYMLPAWEESEPMETAQKSYHGYVELIDGICYLFIYQELSIFSMLDKG